ncbi:MAG: DMT family transporter [Cytophagales bacterium]|nr:DMT family transporter [Cytophagales bacterium]
MISIKLKAIGWILIASFWGSFNDVFTKLLSSRISPIEIACWRSFFSFILILPFVLRDKKCLKTNQIHIHFLRGGLFFCGISLWGLGLKTTYISTAALITFSEPFFLLLLSSLLLREEITYPRLLATLVSFLSVFLIIDIKTLNLASGVVILLLAEVFFALADIINKYGSNNENHLTIVFYYSLFAFIISSVCTINNFVMPTCEEFFYMFCLGLSSDLFLALLLNAFSLADASFLSPFKYSEFIFSVMFGFVFFHEVPTINSFFVITIIVACNVLLMLYENKEKST